MSLKALTFVWYRINSKSSLKRKEDESPDHVDTACGVLPDSNEDEDNNQTQQQTEIVA